jgi:hypothetical protein
MVSKEARKAEHDAIAKRFPKGGKDQLTKVITLGQSYSSVDHKNFGSITPRKTLKLWS